MPFSNSTVHTLAYVHDLSPFLVQFTENFGIRWYGLAYAAAFVCGYFLYHWLSRKGYADMPQNQVGDFILFWVVLGTILGGRIGYMLFYDWDAFIQNPLRIFFVWEGGMSAHGGMIGLIAATWIYAWKYHLSWRNVGDNLVVTAPIGLFFGRCANFINGELYGRATNVSWAMQFPKEIYEVAEVRYRVLTDVQAVFHEPVSAEQAIQLVGSESKVHDIMAQYLTLRHPSQIYEAFGQGILLFVLLFFLRTRCRLPNGVLTGLFFIFYALIRIVTELFREPDAPLVASLSRGQFLSLFLILIGLAFVASAYLRPSYPKAKG
ncbi:MAG: prolipoprotein diacylglyceryl transferase [Chthoniobacterales bacterium]